MTAYTRNTDPKIIRNTREKVDSSGEEFPIPYVWGADRFPFNSLNDGDELFLVTMLKGQLLLSGRLVVDGKPISWAEAEARLGKGVLDEGIKDKHKKIYMLPKKEFTDYFRFDLVLDNKSFRALELYNKDGELCGFTDKLRAGERITSEFQTSLRLSETSAQAIRDVLGLQPVGSSAPTSSGSTTPGSSVDDDAFRMQLIKTRRGQARFRKALLEAYGQRCPITDSAVEDLLEAAHITPHAEHTDYRVSNGLLLRADIHTLFDLNLISIDETYCVQVSPLLQNSEYWSYHRRPLERLPQNQAHHPDRAALRERTARLKLT